MFENVILSVNNQQRKSFHQIIYLGNTTMDATLSFVMANMAQCQLNHIALDPFCGTGKILLFFFVISNDVNLGGILLACAEFGSYVTGSEFDWRLLTAQGNLFKFIAYVLFFMIY